MQAQSKKSLLIFFVAMGLAFSLGLAAGQDFSPHTYAVSDTLNAGESATVDEGVEASENHDNATLQRNIFVPMTEAEMEEAAKNKEPIYYEFVRTIDMNRTFRESIPYEADIAGVNYAGELTKIRVEFNYVRNTINITYQGILEAQV